MTRLTFLRRIETNAAVIVKLFPAIVNPNSGSRAQVLVIRTFVGILKSSPAADVIDQDRSEIGSSGLHFQHKGL
jgi:hypothetical protein